MYQLRVVVLVEAFVLFYRNFLEARWKRVVDAVLR